VVLRRFLAGRQHQSHARAIEKSHPRELEEQFQSKCVAIERDGAVHIRDRDGDLADC